MRAIVCRAFGPPETLVLEERPDPVPGPGELVIEAHAATVTFPDALMLEDRYQFKATPPYVPGGEAAGFVAAVGPDVSDFAPGDRVVGSTLLVGGFAERVRVRASATRRLPDALGFAEATGIGYAYGTALYGLKWRASLRPGETLLVLGAAGNVGLAAVELGKQLGARVIAAASSPGKLAVCRAHGADETIDSAREDLKERTKALTAGRGVDVVFDCVGGAYAEAAVRAIAWEGRFLVIGFTAGITRLPLNLPLLKGCQIVGVFYGAMVQRDPALRDAIQRELDALAAEGRLQPHVSARYPLAEAGRALRALLDREVIGKVVVEPQR